MVVTWPVVLVHTVAKLSSSVTVTVVVSGSLYEYVVTSQSDVGA